MTDKQIEDVRTAAGMLLDFRARWREWQQHNRGSAENSEYWAPEEAQVRAAFVGAMKLAMVD